ncbi:MAG: hypothetical protein IJF83_08515 [Methanobrevibacter sp.]|nr:hypothetical protein [Methanobrevibacter sp.]MBR0371790.1 hypothetical protein [Methanobrevibacter sp.]
MILKIYSEVEFNILKNTHKEYSYNGTKAIFICSLCKKESIRSFKSLTIPFLCKHCKGHLSHTSEEYKEKYKKSMIKKYGVEYTFQAEGIKNKAKKTIFQKYGCENVFQAEEIKEKIKNTNLINIGVEYPGQSRQCQLKGKETYKNKTGYEHNMHNPESKKKVKETTIKRYGGIGGASDEIREKMEETNLKTYGKKSYSSTEEFKEKFRETSYKRYGVEHPTQSNIIKEKIKNTCIKKFGVENCMQNHFIRQKSRKKYIYDNKRFDSSWELAYYIWLTDNNIEFQYQPNIKLKYEYNNKIHYYFPDFLVNNEIHEIKGNLFFKEKDETNEMICPFNKDLNHLAEAKHQCMIEHNVKILTEKEIKLYLDYINKKYGNNFLKQFKRK